MRLTVRVHAGSRREEVRSLEGGALAVWTHAPASEGRANADVCRLVANYLNVRASSVRIASGGHSRLKLLIVEA
ncbi:MAG: DUF167 domain-containing protein [Chloroflexi bacterium]|nr:DUF167 domain-containing protein [Chloroflexota bacterium]